MTSSTVLTPRRLKNLFATISKVTEAMAQHSGLMMDLELFWTMHPNGEIEAVEIAKTANAPRKLRWWDRRTRGWKLYEAHRAAFFAKYGK